MMPEDIKPQDGATTTTPAPAQPAPDSKKASDVVQADASLPKVFDEAYVKELREENAKWRRELREVQAQLTERSTKQAQEEEAKLKEEAKWKELADKREKELNDLRAEIAKQQGDMLRQRIGMEYKLTPKLMSRLQGTTEEELRADAKELADELGLNKPAPEPTPAAPPPATPPTPTARRQVTAVAPDGQPVGETDDQRRARLYKRGAANSPLFNPTTL